MIQPYPPLSLVSAALIGVLGMQTVGTQTARHPPPPGSLTVRIAGATVPADLAGRVIDAVPTTTGIVLRLRSDLGMSLGRFADVATFAFDGPIVPPPPGTLIPFNRHARISHRVHDFNNAYPDTRGEGVTVAVVDAGAIRASHVEFRRDRQNASTTRVQLRTSTAMHEHATHVAGTIGAFGYRDEARGMAPRVSISSFDFGNQLGQVARLQDVVTDQAKISNHSYGRATGWHPFNANWYWYGDPAATEDPSFGRYDMVAAEVDQLLAVSPHLLVFAAAGNDRGDSGPGESEPAHFVWDPAAEAWVPSTTVRPGDGAQDGGFDTLTGLCMLKNAICVGNMSDAVGSGMATTVTSAWGPSDDLRIKPDLIANGDTLTSVGSAFDEHYRPDSGTSMSSATASGLGALVVDQYRRFRGVDPPARTVKAVLIHTAADVGDRGPDLKAGWGAIDMMAAGTFVAVPEGHLIEDISVSASQPFETTFEWTQENVRATLVWADPADRGLAREGRDLHTTLLKHDLNMVLVDPSALSHHPYSVRTSGTGFEIVRNVANTRDTVEVIEARGQSGQWTLRVTADNVTLGTQVATLVVSGLRR